MPPADPSLTGGCQCGAVRFRAARLGRATICHCRMCQKAFGGFFGPLVTAFGVTWTRGEPSHFRSSNLFRRGFCAACGTPLSYGTVPPDPDGSIELAIGAFDDPTRAAPVLQVNPADKLPFYDRLSTLPLRDSYPQAWLETMARIVSYQHPDHDTAHWPPARGEAGRHG